MNIATKVCLANLLLLLGGLGGTIWLLDRQRDQIIQEEGAEQARTVLTFSQACEDYAADTLGPAVQGHNAALLARIPPGDRAQTPGVILEAESVSLLTNGVFQAFHRRLPGYSFRMHSLNPLNPDDRADAEEEELIARFEADSGLQEISGLRTRDGQQQFYVARPIPVLRSCLECHGSPEAAPPELVRRFGARQGYGWKEGGLAGIDLVTIPTDGIRARQTASSRHVLAIFALLAAVLLGLQYVLFERLVNRRLRRAALVMGQVAANPAAEATLDASKPDELGWVAAAFNRMAAALRTSHLSLERQVAERTTDLVRANQSLTQEVAERKRTEVALAQAKEAAEDANRFKSVFLASMSHELRTPLNAILGYSELLEDDLHDAGQEGFVPDLRKINQSGKHLLALINDVLDLSKIEAGKMEVYPESFEVAPLVQDVASTVKPLVEKKANTLQVVCANGLGSAHSDATRIRQCLLNLLSNAAKFTEQGTIVLTADREARNGGDWLVFRVRDSGIGMTTEQMGKLFQAFSQAEATTSRQYGGTGLGLAISRKFCQLLGGDVTVASEYGKGSTFTMTLPAEAPSAPAGDGQPRHSA